MVSLPHGILGLLNYGESTGYDLTKTFEDSLNNFWHAQSSQIYRELNRMEGEGLVTSRNVIQDGRPNKRLYSITDAGREAFAAWLHRAELEFENPHHAALMRVFFGADDPEATLDMLRQCREYCLRALEANCAATRQVIEDYARNTPDGQRRSAYWQMTLDYGATQTRAIADWAERCIERMEGEGQR